MSHDPPRIADLEGEQPPEVDFMRSVLRSQREELPPLSAMEGAHQAARTGVRSGAATSRLLWPGVSALTIALASGVLLLSYSRQPAAEAPAAAAMRDETGSVSTGGASMLTRPAAAPSQSARPSEPKTPEAAPPSIPVESLPSANRRAAAVRPALPEHETCDDEVELIDSADAALRAGNAARALLLTQEHAGRCATGTFIQERERIAIEALAKLDRLGAMRERARAFEERFPSSPHLRRVRSVVEQHRVRAILP